MGIAYFIFIAMFGAFRDGVLSRLIPETLDVALLAAVLALTPVVLVLSWMYDWTPEGIQRTSALSREEEGVMFRVVQVAALAVAVSLAVLLWVAITSLSGSR